MTRSMILRATNKMLENLMKYEVISLHQEAMGDHIMAKPGGPRMSPVIHYMKGEYQEVTEDLMI